MASVTYHKGRADFETPYNPLFVDAIKKINSRYRSYEPGSKVWTVWDPYVQDGVYALKTCFPDAEEIGEYQGRQRTDPFDFSQGFGSHGSEGRDYFWQESPDGTRRRRVYTDTGEYGNWVHNPNKGSENAQDAPGRTQTPTGPYQVLMVSPDAPWAVVRAVYGALAKTYHPDVYKGDDGPDRMKAINQAYAEVKKQRGE